MMLSWKNDSDPDQSDLIVTAVIAKELQMFSPCSRTAEKELDLFIKADSKFSIESTILRSVEIPVSARAALLITDRNADWLVFPRSHRGLHPRTPARDYLL